MFRVIVLVAVGAACESNVGHSADSTAPAYAKVMSYNLANLVGVEAESLAAHIAAAGPDFVMAQECRECDDFGARLPSHYQLAGRALAGVAIVFDSDSWRVVDRGDIVLGDNDDGWGQRVASWALALHNVTDQCVIVYSTHWCVTVRSPNDACDVQRQLAYADTLLGDIAERGTAEFPVIVGGDFNVFDGFEAGPVITHLVASGLVDAYRQIDPDGDATTFAGNSWAPSGRLDYVFVSDTITSLDALIERDAVPTGQGSDHFAVSATVQIAGATPTR